jgi:hypothetical protein
LQKNVTLFFAKVKVKIINTFWANNSFQENKIEFIDCYFLQHSGKQNGAQKMARKKKQIKKESQICSTKRVAS